MPWKALAPDFVTIDIVATPRYSAFWLPLSILNSCNESGAGMFARPRLLTPDVYAEPPLPISLALTPLRVKLFPPQ